MVTDYYEKAGLWPDLEALGFHLVGYGCTTCIGNSGPLPEPVSAAVNEHDLTVVSVLSGNRNFEGRINPDVKMNYLASPPLVIAYALAGTMDFDFETSRSGSTRTAARCSCATSGRAPSRSSPSWARRSTAGDVREGLRRRLRGRRALAGPPHARTARRSSGTDSSTYVRKPPYFEGMTMEPVPVEDIAGARVLALLGDSVTTDHISPAGSIKADSPAGKYLAEHGIDRKDFNSYGSRRGNHEVMIRGTFANIRLKNLLLADADGNVVEGGLDPNFLTGEQTTIYDASVAYQAAGVPLVMLAGKEYGSGSSRDWAAKGTSLLGVRAVIAESFERIHRSNLIGMGVVPLQFPAGQTAASLGLDGTETFAIERRERVQRGEHPKSLMVTATKADGIVVEFEAVGPHRHPRRGRLLQERRHPAVRAPLAGSLLDRPRRGPQAPSVAGRTVGSQRP